MFSTSELDRHGAGGGHTSPTKGGVGARIEDGQGPDVVVRRVDAGETVELLQLASLAALASPNPGESSPRPLPLYLGSQDDVGRHSVIAETIDGNGHRRCLVGLGVLRPVDERMSVADIFLYVVPNQRGRGIGPGLLDALVRLADELGVRRLRIGLPEAQLGSLGLLSRLSTFPRIVREGHRLIVEFPTAAALIV